MPELFFTADQHFWHDNILHYCNRPFRNVNQMNEQLIELHNKVVKPNDTVWMLGDYTLAGGNHFESVQRLTRRLNGRKHFVLGNHDKFKPFTYVGMGFHTVHTVEHLEKLDIYLVHDPAVANVLRDKLWFSGHVHKLFKHARNVVNVGVDQWNFMPVHIDELLEYVKEQNIEVYK